MSSVMGRNRRSSTTPSGLTADSFAKFFCDKVNDVRSSTAGAADPEYAAFHDHPLDEFTQLSISDVERLIKDSPAKACGLDPIPTWLVKEILHSPLNRSLLQGQFPENIRIANPQEVYPRSVRVQQLQAISNLPFISKVLERLLLHLHSNGLVSFRNINLHIDAAIPQRPPSWR